MGSLHPGKLGARVWLSADFNDGFAWNPFPTALDSIQNRIAPSEVWTNTAGAIPYLNSDPNLNASPSLDVQAPPSQLAAPDLHSYMHQAGCAAFGIVQTQAVGAPTQMICGSTTLAGTSAGFSVRVSAGNQLQFQVVDAAGAQVGLCAVNPAPTPGAFWFLARALAASLEIRCSGGGVGVAATTLPYAAAAALYTPIWGTTRAGGGLLNPNVWRGSLRELAFFDPARNVPSLETLIAMAQQRAGLCGVAL